MARVSYPKALTPDSAPDSAAKITFR